MEYMTCFTDDYKRIAMLQNYNFSWKIMVTKSQRKSIENQKPAATPALGLSLCLRGRFALCCRMWTCLLCIFVPSPISP